MSGHSHYSTIKRAKEANDQARGKIFSRYAREIAIAVREGGGTDPAFNYKLRMVLDKARAANMPKDNIERALVKSAGGALEKIIYEGFGPSGIGILVEVATDNRNRTSQDIKNLFERGGGNLAGPGAVSYNFENKGLLVVPKGVNSEEQMLKLIDLGVEDVEETTDGIEVYAPPEKLMETKEMLEKGGIVPISAELVMKPKVFQTVDDVNTAKKCLTLLDLLNDHDDVQKVYSNLDIPDAIVTQVSTAG
jgi:YebC/PmpR family DNA-binding regulatory protein